MTKFELISTICSLILAETHEYTAEEIAALENPVLELKALDKEAWEEVVTKANKDDQPTAKRYTVAADGTICWL